MGLEVVRRLVQEVWNDRRFELLPELFADPFDHGGRVDTVAGIKQWHADDARIWADTRYEVVREVGGAEQVAIQWRATARQVGQWGPVPPSGREISWDGVHFFTLLDGRITAMWAMGDVFAKAMQLGAQIVPASS